MMEKNLDEFIDRKQGTKSRWERSSIELAKALEARLDNIETVECYDVSNISGSIRLGLRFVLIVE
jgi:hypothetical protein